MVEQRNFYSLRLRTFLILSLSVAIQNGSMILSAGDVI